MCVFCEIVAGRVDATKVLDDDDFVAFLDHRPLFPGHVLVVPRLHVETLVDLPEDMVGPLFACVQRLAGAVQTGMRAQGTFVAMNNKVSQSVPHLHVHVVPRNRKDGLRGFFWPRHRYRTDGEREEAGRSIRAALSAANA